MTRPFEPAYEQALAKRVATVKVVLAIANLLVIWFDRTVPLNESSRSLQVSLLVGILFLMYMICGWIVVSKNLVPIAIFQSVIPFVDLLAIFNLLMSTDGYLSPFNLWFAIAIVSSGFSRSPKIPVAAAIAAIATQAIVASFPQMLPLDKGTFMARTIFLFGFAGLVAFLSNQMLRQSQALNAMTLFGQKVAATLDSDEANELFCSSLKGSLHADDVIIVDQPVESAGIPLFPLEGATDEPIYCRITRKKPLSADEVQLVRALAERLTSSLKRIALSQELVKAAAREERQRYADELHDTHLQTLAAIDMHAELARRLSDDDQVNEQLGEIKTATRAAATKTRAFIMSAEELPPSGPEALREELLKRWPTASFSMADDAHLSEGQWKAARMLVQEGANNARQHAKATKLDLSIAQSGDNTDIVLQSDGQSPPAVVRYGYGLRRLEAVVNVNHGSLELTASPTGGSVLRASFTSGDGN